MLSRVPKSLSWFLATGGIFLLQLFPVPGIFMMMLAAPFWSVLTVNAGFIGLGVEAATGRTNRLWMILPALWFGGYGVTAALSQFQLAALNKDLVRANAGQALPFDPARNALVFESAGGLLSSAAEELVKSTSLPVAYDANRNFEGASHLSHRLGTAETCDRIQKDPAAAGAGIRAFGFHRDGRFVEGQCIYYAPRDPGLPAYRVSASEKQVDDALLPRRLVTIRIDAPSGRSATLRTAAAEPLGWIPLPVIGCAMTSTNWGCFATFYRSRIRPAGGSKALGGGEVAAVADALGLGGAPAAAAAETAGESVGATLDGIVAARAEASLANLDRMIAGGEGRFTVNDVAGLTERPDLLGPRAGKMAAAFAAAAAGGYATREKAGVLSGLLAMLAPADFHRVEDRLLAVYQGGGEAMAASDQDPLVTRLGDLGQRALPMLERNIESRGNDNVILGLCRVGPAAAGSADRVAAVLRATSRSSDRSVHSAAYVALLRMGRADLADSDPDSASRYRKGEYETMRRSVGPSSPPGMCVDDWGLPRLPDVPARS
jgi:hypothetical protein